MKWKYIQMPRIEKNVQTCSFWINLHGPNFRLAPISEESSSWLKRRTTWKTCKTDTLCFWSVVSSFGESELSLRKDPFEPINIWISFYYAMDERVVWKENQFQKTKNDILCYRKNVWTVIFRKLKKLDKLHHWIELTCEQLWIKPWMRIFERLVQQKGLENWLKSKS